MAEVSDLDKRKRIIVLIMNEINQQRVLCIVNGFFPFALNITFIPWG